MDKTYTDKIIHQYISKLSKVEDSSSEYRIICEYLGEVLAGKYHIDVATFVRSSNHFTLFYKINSTGSIEIRS